jgi:hypothetical protein
VVVSFLTLSGCYGTHRIVSEPPELLMRPAVSITTLKLKEDNIKLSDVILQHNLEATVCKETEQQLKSLQDWVDSVTK